MSSIPIKTAPELDKMRAVNKVVGLLLKALYGEVKPGRDHGGPGPFRGQFHPRPRRGPRLPGLPRLSGHDLRSRQRAGGARDPGQGRWKKATSSAWTSGLCWTVLSATRPGPTRWAASARRPQSCSTVTRESLEKGIAAARNDGHVQDIGAAVQAHAEGAGYGVVRDFVGHGIGRAMHEEPQIPNYGQPGTRAQAEGRHDPRHRAHGERRAPPK